MIQGDADGELPLAGQRGRLDVLHRDAFTGKRDRAEGRMAGIALGREAAEHFARLVVEEHARTLRDHIVAELQVDAQRPGTIQHEAPYAVAIGHGPPGSAVRQRVVRGMGEAEAVRSFDAFGGARGILVHERGHVHLRKMHRGRRGHAPLLGLVPVGLTTE